ncbi:OmpA family protein [Thiobacillus denitrificans]|uniref:Membrane protein n=1 Tax=Thiobacillus denitrificans TaxID=36861 RepID=A0A106BN18_THIDE|nr:OmpA family protein [Thiobacillus denitrificans]KVW95490.1 membrane protein [Thiobacillus denitrificans]
MRTPPFLFSIVGTILLSAGVVTAHAAEAPFYNPTNAASPTGFTIGYELFRTIGCPGRGLFDTPCPVPPPPAPVAAAPEPEPAVAPLAPAPVAAAPEPAPLAPVAEPVPVATLVLEGVNFDFDKAVIRPGDYAKLDQNVTTLKTWGDVDVEVAGHTCSIGTEAYNLGLSQRRAEAVRNYLISKGVSADRLTAKGYGESRPAVSNDTREGRAQNRRVELVRYK